MKRNYRILFAFVISVIVLSCNQSSSTKEPELKVDSTNTIASNPEEALLDCSGTGNFFIPSKKAKEMVSHFCGIYRKDDTGREIAALVDSVWIDSSIIVSLAHFLDSSDRHDGVRIYNGAYTSLDATNHPGQKYPNESTVVLVPTITRTSTALGQSTHQDDYATFTMPDAYKKTEFKNYNLSKKEVDTLKIKFQKLYRLETNPDDLYSKRDSLSRAIWFDQCVIIKLAQFLKDPNNHLDGVRIYSGAYDSFSSRTGDSQNKSNQSTLLMVLTSVGHNDNWKFLDNKYMNDNKFKMASYNHGELCPKLCD